MKRPNASIGFILATLIIDALGFGIIIPIVPSLVLKLSGLPASAASFWVGALLAVFSTMQFLCAPILGALSDRYGRRPILLLSLSGIGASYLIMATAPSLAWLFIGRMIAGATAANVSTANAYIADVTPPEKRAQRFGLIGATFGLGFIIGPALGGLLGGIDLRLPFLVSAALAAVNVGYGALVLPESLAPGLRRPFEWRRANPVATLHTIGEDRTYALLALAWCCAWGAMGTLPASFVLVNQVRFDWGPQQNGLALMAVGIGAALVQGVLIRPIIKRLGEKRAALCAYVMAASAYLCFAFATTPPLLFAGIAFQAFGAISGPAIQAILSTRAGPDRQGAVQGALSSLQGLTAILSPLAAGGLFSLFAHQGASPYFPGAPFLMAATMLIIAFLAVRAVPMPRS